MTPIPPTIQEAAQALLAAMRPELSGLGNWPPALRAAEVAMAWVAAARAAEAEPVFVMTVSASGSVCADNEKGRRFDE
jgi:hypothetical protein